eukprot:TRINITY_DN10306_c0_g1_i1.p1 TRINITY_DN10306_c0_g1~~TRINITY_DN10306_c0_g1_i1.p1  ORF type:complete len:207 (-),score=69.38 TRINITY_DN10306_c0_g1_i1:21-590(-)
MMRTEGKEGFGTAISLWLIPSQTTSESKELGEILSSYINKFNSPSPFEPHVTLVGGISPDIDPEELKLKMKQVARNFKEKKLEVKFKEVVIGKLYFQSVLVEVEKEEKISLLFDSAKDVFSLHSLPVFYPHLSLYYGFDDHQKVKVAKEVKEEKKVEGRKFDVTYITAVKCVGPVSDWFTLFSVDLIDQ